MREESEKQYQPYLSKDTCKISGPLDHSNLPQFNFPPNYKAWFPKYTAQHVLVTVLKKMAEAVYSKAEPANVCLPRSLPALPRRQSLALKLLYNKN